MVGKRIIVSVSNDFSIDQRVHRICNSLQSCGHNVILIGRKLDNNSLAEVRNYETRRFKLLFNHGMLFYICLNIRFFFFLLFTRADVFLANDLDTLLANTMAAFFKRKKLVYDSHELFTEVPELKDTKLKKKIWLAVEKVCIRKADVAYTVCQSIADYYNNLYGIKMTVIRNLPVSRPFIDNFEERENILLYQGALNKDRGIELMINAMTDIEGYKLIIAGKGNLAEMLKQQVLDLNLSDKVEFAGVLDFESLYKLSIRAKLGFSLENGSSLNYKFALPNKIFDYIQAGVPVLCSNLPEMKRIIDDYLVGETINIQDKEQLAAKIKNLINDNAKLFTLHKNCQKASILLNWEQEEQKLIKLFD